MYEVKFDHPYWGEVTLTGGTVGEILAAAMKYDHPCEDTTGCDVANMAAGGFLLVATHRMLGATECPSLEAVWDAIPAHLRTRELVEQDENEWWDTVKDSSVFCPECDTLLYGERVYLDDAENLPSYCTNCAKGFDPGAAPRPTRGK